MLESGEPRSSSWDNPLGGAHSETQWYMTMTHKADAVFSCSLLVGLHLSLVSFLKPLPSGSILTGVHQVLIPLRPISPLAMRLGEEGTSVNSKAWQSQFI